jgi:hypothetical protein
MSKYDSLYAHLSNCPHSMVKMSFVEIAGLVGGLPASATDYRAWWSNEAEGSHVQAKSWMAAGYEVTEVELGSWVVFSKK